MLRQRPLHTSAVTPPAPTAVLWWGLVVVVATAALAPGRLSLAHVVAAAPSAVVAVAAAAASCARISRAGTPSAWEAGLLGALASLAVGVPWTLATMDGTSLGAALVPLPASAGASLLLLVLAVATRWGADLRLPRGWVRRALSSAVGAAVVGALVVVPTTTASAAVEPSTVAPCGAGQQQRSYAISAATVDVPFNRWGATLKSARIFALNQDLPAIRNWWRPLNADPALDPAKNRRLRPRPLVLRANEGECVQVTLTNRMSTTAAHGLTANPRVGISASGMVVNARTASGARVGFDSDSTIGINQSITYYWRVPAQEGLYLFQDMATPAGGEHDAGSRGVGLYGAMAVEPAGSTWTDPRSGKLLSGTPGVPTSAYKSVSTQSGELYIEADIHPPGKPSFRESIQLAQDEIPGIGMGFNFGSEPMEAREAKKCPDCVGEETWLSSWPYGDPALIKLASGQGPWLPNAVGERKEKEDCGLPESCFVSNVFHTYAGDATKIRFGLSGVKETHVFHLHAHQWLADPRGDAVTGEGPDAKPESTTIDSQSFGPGEAYSAELLYGAGSQNRTFGDSIFHCHLYPHFAEGFWGLMRVHDVGLDGTTATPDGVNVRPLVPLPGNNPPAATPDNPGFPGMIPGTFGFRAPQPPGSITEGGVDGTPSRPAPRLVAGKQIDGAKLAVEDAVMRANNGGEPGKPGAPFSDPCPTGSREVDYDVTVLQRDLVYNEAGQHDPQGRIMVLTKDVQAVLDGTKKAEPLFIRVNAGDCINFSLTNMAPNWTGGDAFQELAQTNMAGGHVHLVKFDVTASDGGSNGWNYQQAAFTQEQMEFNRKQAAGEIACSPSASFYGGESSGCRIADRTSWTPPRDSSGMWGQTIHERWYADYELRTVFTHDHHFAALVQNHGQYGALIVEPRGFDVRDPATGKFLQPVNSSANGTPCGSRCSGTAVGESVDVIGPGANDDFREYGLAIADFVPLVKRGGDPTNPDDVVNPPDAPEPYPDDDPGTFAINYRNAPLSERRTYNGDPTDPAYRFSSWVHGDPWTPLLQGYARDNVKMRVIQGSQEEQHLFQVNGLRWREEPDDPGSPLVNAQTIGISEAFNAEMPGFDCKATDTPCRGDYLYGGTSMDDLWNGMWGIMRVHGAQQQGLLSLPDNPARLASSTATPAPKSRPTPPKAAGPGKTCPSTAPVKTFDVVAINSKLVYNSFGDHDPKGLMYVLAEDEAAVRSGAKKPEPLVIRANAGDCVEVSLRNALPALYSMNVNGVGGDPAMVLEPSGGTKSGTRVSLHPQLVRSDVRLSDGAAVGFNPDTTAGVGETVSYEWFADTELGATNLLDFGDVRGHRQHGLAAALVIEPQHATYHHPVTGAPLRSGTVADIRVPGQEDFRETTLVYQDGLDLRLSSGAQVPDQTAPEPDVAAGPAESEDAGEKGVNYTNEPLHRRIGAAPGYMATWATATDWSNALSSEVHGDPGTPIARSYAGDQLRVRVLGGNRPRQTGFSLDGASWRQEPYDTESPLVGVQGGIGTGKAVNVHARLTTPGDNLWSSPMVNGLSQGVWGLARVYPQPADGADFTPAAPAKPDNPFTAGNAPLQRLERSSVSIDVFDDADGDGTRDDAEKPTAGVEVRLLGTDGTSVLTAATGADGRASFSPQRGVYDVSVQAPTGTRVVGDATQRVDLTDDAAASLLTAGLSSAAAAPEVTAVVFEDLDADGVRDSGEAGVSGWTVSLTGSETLAPQTTGDDGSATFASVPAGTWSAGLTARDGWRTTTALPVEVTVASTPVEVALGVAQGTGDSGSTGLTVRAVDDVDADGARDEGEPTIVGLVVEITPEGGTATRTLSTADGVTTELAGQAASVRVLLPDTGLPMACDEAVVTTSSGEAPAACADGVLAVPADASELVLLSAFDKGVVTTALFDDADRDGKRGATEAPLVDWPVALVTSAGVEIARSTTDLGGVTSAVVDPGTYRVVPMPPVSGVAWTSTGTPGDVTVARAGAVTSVRGWVQPASVSVSVFHDLDKDGVREDGDLPLGDRLVKLLSSTGTQLATAYTDGSGRAAFPARAGTAYKVNVPVTSPWTATAPLVSGTAQTTVPVTAPADGAPAVVAFGHYNTVDRTPPPAPVATPGSGPLTGPTLVTLSTSETGAVLRYTLDGTTPTATRGMVYAATSPGVRISMDRVLRAVAVDANGNVSPVLAASYDLPWTGTSAVLTASAWSVTSGGTPRGGAVETAADDGREMGVASVAVAGRPTVDVTASVPVPSELRSAAALNVSASVRTTLRNTRVRAQYWDASASLWRVLTNATVGLEESKLDVDLGAATKLVGTDGLLKVRLIADHGSPFDLAVDQVTVTAVNRS